MSNIKVGDKVKIINLIDNAEVDNDLFVGKTGIVRKLVQLNDNIQTENSYKVDLGEDIHGEILETEKYRVNNGTVYTVATLYESELIKINTLKDLVIQLNTVNGIER